MPDFPKEIWADDSGRWARAQTLDSDVRYVRADALDLINDESSEVFSRTVKDLSDEIVSVSAERDRWAGRCGEMRELVESAKGAIAAAQEETEAEWRGHDRAAARASTVVQEWRNRAQKALTGGKDGT